MSETVSEIAVLRAALAAAEARASVAEGALVAATSELAQVQAVVSASEDMIRHLRLHIAKLQREQYGHSAERRARLRTCCHCDVHAGRHTKLKGHVSQSFGQGHKALTAQHDMEMFKVAIGQPEVIEPMKPGLARNGDAKIVHVGEIRLRPPPMEDRERAALAT